MKYCPRCGKKFDDSLQFCLDDGALLISDDDTETVFASTGGSAGFGSGFNQHQTITPAPPTPLQPNPFTKFLLPVILLLLVATGVFAFLWWKNGQNQTAALTTNVNAAADDDLKLKEKELALKERELELKKKELESANADTPTSSAPKPLPPARGAGRYDNYSGNIGSSNTTFSLSWANNTVSGNFYYNGNPNQVYTLSGTNYQKGTADIKAYDGSRLEGTFKLYKNITGNQVCWGGSFYYASGGGGTAPVNFCRYR